MSQLDELTGFLQAHMPKRAMLGFDSQMDEIVFIPAQRDTGLGQYRLLGTATLLAGAVQHVASGDYAIGVGGNYVASVKGDAQTEISGQQTSKVTGNINTETGGTLTEKIAALRKSVAAGGQQVIGPTVHIGSEGVNALTMMLETIDLLAELAQQCATHTHSGTGAPLQAGAFSQTATKAGSTRSKYSKIIA